MSSSLPRTHLPKAELLPGVPYNHRGPPRARHWRARASGDVDRGLSLLELTNKVFPQKFLVSGAKQAWKLTWQAMVRELAPQDSTGAYKRPKYSFDAPIGGSDAAFPAEPGRYHLYLGNACPWCHRVLLVLALRGLASPRAGFSTSTSSPSSSPGSSPSSGLISVTHLLDVPEKATRGGWIMPQPDPVFGARDLWEVYEAASPGFRGRCTAPCLVDRVSRRIVSNESAGILASLAALQLPGALPVELRPAALVPQIQVLNDEIYRNVNNAVYRTGFATNQAAYDAASSQLHTSLSQLDARLSRQRFLLGERLTEPDVRLFPTLVRFDAVYASIFKCGRRRVADYPNLQAWLRDMWQLQLPAGALQVRDTVDVDACRTSYYTNLFPLNPGGIVPAGPSLADLALDAPAGRGPSSWLEACWVAAAPGSGRAAAAGGVAAVAADA